MSSLSTRLMAAHKDVLTAFAATRSAQAMTREIVFKRNWKAFEAAQKRFARLARKAE